MKLLSFYYCTRVIQLLNLLCSGAFAAVAALIAKFNAETVFSLFRFE